MIDNDAYDTNLTMTDEEISDNIRALMKGLAECDSDFANDLDAMLKEIKALSIQAQGFAVCLSKCKDEKLKPALLHDVVVSIEHLAVMVSIVSTLKDYVTGELETPPNFHFTP